MIWLRCRLGLQIGTGHAARCFSLAQALRTEGIAAGLVLDEDAAAFTARVAAAGLDHVTIAPGQPLAEEAARYPAGPVVLDLSNPVMLGELPDLVAALRAQGRKVGLVEGLDREAYTGGAAPDLIITPYLGGEPSKDRPDTAWIGGGEYAVLGAEYAAAPTPLDDRDRILLMMSGSDPWGLTEHVLDAASPVGDRLLLVLGGSLPADRARALARQGERMGAEIDRAPPSLHPHFMRSRAALIGPGLVKYEAVATGTPAVIISPGEQFVATQSAFVAAGLARVLNVRQPDFPAALAAALEAALRHEPDWPAMIDGQGARRLARALRTHLGE